MESVNAIARTSPQETPVALVIEEEIISFTKGFPYIANKTTYAPIEEIAKSIDVTVSYQINGDILLEKEERSLLFTPAKQTVTSAALDAQLLTFFEKDETWFVPVRFVGEYFGYQADSVFSDKHHIVRLTKDSKMPHAEFFNHNQLELDQYYQQMASYMKPNIYLTFDDGPAAAFNPILETLEKYEAKATFFMIEPQMRKYPELVKNVVEAGHYPALHSVSHDKSKLYGPSPDPFINEMLVSQETLYEITGHYSFLTRAPYGSKPYLNEIYADALSEEGMKLWDWNVDPMDWKYETNQPKQIVENIKHQVEKIEKTGKPIVVLLHVREGTAKVLPEIIQYLQDKGYNLAAYDPNQHVSVNFWNDERL